MDRMCCIPEDLLIQAATALQRDGNSHLSSRLFSFVKKPDYKVEKNSMMMELVPPWVDLDSVCTKKHVLQFIREHEIEKDRVSRAIKTLPDCEVFSRKPLLITKAGFNLLKDRLWNS